MLEKDKMNHLVPKMPIRPFLEIPGRLRPNQVAVVSSSPVVPFRDTFHGLTTGGLKLGY